MIKRLILALLISALATILIFEFTSKDLKIEFIDPFYIFVAFLMQVLFWIFWTLRLKTIVKSLGYKISFTYTFKVTMIGMFIAAITPSSAGGEPIRAKMLNDRGISAGEAAFVVLVERFLDAIFFSTALPIFVAFTGYGLFGLKVVAIFVVILTFSISALYLIFKNNRNLWKFASLFGRKKDKVANELIKFRQAALKLKDRKKDLVSFIFLTVVMWSLGFTIPSLILLSLGQNHFFFYSYTAQLTIVLVSLVPITPGSSGIAEFSMAYLYSMFVDSSILGILIPIWRLITYHSNIVVGALILFFRERKEIIEENVKNLGSTPLTDDEKKH